MKIASGKKREGGREGGQVLTSKLEGCLSYAVRKASSARVPVGSSFNKAMPRQAKATGGWGGREGGRGGVNG